jgi:hypothetical protein
MDLEAEIRAADTNPERLEQLYKEARQIGQTDAFQSALQAIYEAELDNQLYAAWYYRFQYAADELVKTRRGVNWIAAVLLSILTGLIFWAFSDVERLMLDELPYLLLLWSTIATMSALVFLALTAKNNYVRVLSLGMGLLAVTAYALVLAPALDPPWLVQQYVILAAIHIPLLCWIALGISVLGFNSSTEDRFAFMKKSIEVMIVAGLYLIAGLVFGGITVGMFQALGISLPEIWLRLIVAGGFGLLPVLAVASVYDPEALPSEQDFDQGLSKFVATMMRLLLPLTLGVLVIYVMVIPFYFLEPYENRDVLVVYNLMLFGIIGLLLGATPMRGDDLSPMLQKWLRIGIIVVTILAVLISIYALSATFYRTVDGGITLNRLTIIGWNVINIGILLWLIYKQFKDGQEKWVESLQSVFCRAANAYMIWGLFLLVAAPLLLLIA